MSLTKQVAEIIAQRGSGTIDELCPVLPLYSRMRVARALEYASAAGLIYCDGTATRRAGADRGRLPGRYFPRHVRPPASVWEISKILQINGAWPPLSAGRTYMLLSAGDAQEEMADA